MPSLVQQGERILEIDLLTILPPDEGALSQYYGHIGSGKTTIGTCDAIDDLDRGQVVYCNWMINWDGYDQRKIWYFKLLGYLGLKRVFRVYPKSNYHFVDLIDMENVKVDGMVTGLKFYDWFAKLTSCRVKLDEGHILYDSYMATKMDLKHRVAILDTRHYDRSVDIISQRPSAIHVTLRGNVNQFFKCEMLGNFFFIKRFIRTEFQDVTSSDLPNEEREIIVDPETGDKSYGKYLYGLSQKNYWGTKKVFNSFNSKYRRGNTPESQINNAEFYKIRSVDWYKGNSKGTKMPKPDKNYLKSKSDREYFDSIK